MWEVEYTDQFEEWWEGLSIDQQERIAAVVDLLGQEGPKLKRPLVGAVKGSKIQNLKELVIPGKADELRILFVFDPRRAAILLLGGDKLGFWKDWRSPTRSGCMTSISPKFERRDYSNERTQELQGTARQAGREQSRERGQDRGAPR